MRINRVFPLMFAALCFAACGSSSSTKHPDAHVNGPDASTTPDAPGGGTPDAANAALTGFGQSCPLTGTNACVTGSATTCAAISSTATNGWCTMTCGTTTAPTTGNPTPPTGGTAMCQTAFTSAGGTSPADGTPGCVIYDSQSMPGKDVWYCAIGCGTLPNNGGNLGGCPGGLACNTTDNLCE
jgi:hypothetical protein